MNKKKTIWLIMLILTTMVLGCRPSQNLAKQEEFANDETTSTAQQPQTETVQPSDTPTSISNLAVKAEGPLLLIQTDVDTYQIIDVLNQSAIDFQPPLKNQNYGLAKSLSPSRSQMLFQINAQEILLMSLDSELIETIIDDQSDLSAFDPYQAAIEAHNALPDLNYSEEGTQTAVMHAWENSKSNIQWYQSDQNLLFVLTTSETSTSLFLSDLLTGRHEQLENMPGLVEQFWVGPNKDLILIKKGLIFEPGIWQEDAYYLIDQSQNSIQPISMPEDVENPSVFWFSADSIGIIHQPAPVGGINFSLVDIATRERQLILSESFSRLIIFGTHLLTLHHDQEALMTNLAMRMSDGRVVNTETLEGICFVSATVDDHRLLMNCETESYLVEEDTLSVSSYGEPLLMFSRSPNKSAIIMVTRPGETTLLNAALRKQQSLTLEGTPLEIRWLPDSSGFLYRTANRLYHYDLASETSHLLITSDFFGDYRNLNAVWLQLD